MFGDIAPEVITIAVQLIIADLMLDIVERQRDILYENADRNITMAEELFAEQQDIRGRDPAILDYINGVNVYTGNRQCAAGHGPAPATTTITRQIETQLRGRSTWQTGLTRTIVRRAVEAYGSDGPFAMAAPMMHDDVMADASLEGWIQGVVSVVTRENFNVARAFGNIIESRLDVLQFGLGYLQDSVGAIGGALGSISGTIDGREEGARVFNRF